ncbi:MAG: divalent-cation tolerance protein CutA [Pseudomonadota bacterium]
MAVPDPAPDTPLLAYMTAPDAETAMRLADGLVAERIVACVNVFPPMTAVFQWKGAVETASEIAMIAKTTTGRAAALRAFIAERHPYETPCLTLTPIIDGAPDFLAWISAETRGD